MVEDYESVIRKDGDEPSAEERDEARARGQKTVAWLEEHCDWEPFGGDW